MLPKLFFSCIVVLVIFNSCLDSYALSIDDYDNLLVEDGLITDENKSHEITLTHSTTDIDEDSSYETSATGYVTDNIGDFYYFTETSSGVYSSDSTDLIVKVGDKYTLHIQTQDELSYQSEGCEVLSQSTIDSVYYKKDSEWDDSGENFYEGLCFYADGRSESTYSYGRLMYAEEWKFRSAWPENFIILEDKSVEPDFWEE